MTFKYAFFASFARRKDNVRLEVDACAIKAADVFATCPSEVIFCENWLYGLPDIFRATRMS
ncbi:hypothetical protein [Enterococcus faecium]|uniref:hypothetical protein n=1 Tax=Enterococcus faecium TaxID=1352 RepID=UPI00039E9096|nr:hypothetical protein [Enterococcus faecium]